MPGLLGAIGVPSGVLDALEREALARWPDAVVDRGVGSILVGHAFGEVEPVLDAGHGVRLALDGEWSLYREVVARVPSSVGRAARVRDDVLDPDLSSTGNVARVDDAESSVHLAVDLTGTFPLYYARAHGGLLFGSLLRPVAGLADAARDDLAVLEFLRQAYTVGGKTAYRDVRRLLPGQSLTYRTGAALRIHERSDAWSEAGPADRRGAEVAAEAWDRLTASVQRGLPDAGAALMMSGGWDSRTLLAGAGTGSKHLHCYAHGDLQSRELALVRRLCDAAGASCSLEPIDERVLDLESLGQGFMRTENVVFPHWHRAGTLLADRGFAVVGAGVLGEILGGHYGPAMLAGSVGKALAIGTTIIGLDPRRWTGRKRSAADFLHARNVGHHWYLDRGYEADLSDSRDRMNGDIDAALSRLRARGVTEEVSLVEAFVSEHRGTQYINAQLLSCRASMDIALPFGGGELFSFSSRLPLSTKIHNKLNRRMLRAHAPHLLRAPLAATLVPAGWPLLMQEASRAGRKAYEGMRSAAHGATAGRLGRPHLGWVNFDFLGRDHSVAAMADDLRSEIWDKQGIARAVRALSGSTDVRRFHPMFDQLSKIYTIDLMLRATKVRIS